MLRTDDRLLLSEAILPPDGFALDLLVGTTYSLQLAALLSVPLALSFADWEGEDGAPTSDPIAALDAVRRHADRITVFCQAGATATTEQPPLVTSWLEDVVVPVRAPLGGVFHPKVWVARYRSPDDPQPRYRVLCGSRNLTFDRSWDTVAVLDGAPSPRGGLVAASAALSDFLAALPALATNGCTVARASSIVELASQLRRVRFEAPEGFENVAFSPLGIEGHRSDPLAVRRTRMLVVSPFVGSRALRRLTTERDENILVSRTEELDGIAASDLAGWSRVCSVVDGGVTEATPDDQALRGLHAKLFVVDAGSKSSVWTGSLNATTAALERNVEFLVRLDGRRSQCGVDKMLGTPDDEDAFVSMLQDVELRDEPVPPDPAVALERELDDAAHHVAERELRAVVTEDGPSRCAVELRADPPPELAPDIELRCWPLTSHRDAANLVTDPSSGLLGYFRNQEVSQLTAFFVIELRVDRGNARAVKSAVLRVALVDAPEGRREAILRDLLSDPDQLMRFLLALLSFDASDAGEGKLGALGEGSASRRSGHPETPLLESLLRSLEHDPSRLDAIHSLVEDLKREGVADALPDGFFEIFDPIYAVRKEIRA